MAIPGYVVPGQIICPIFEKVTANDTETSTNTTTNTSSTSGNNQASPFIIRKYIPGHGVSVSHLPNDIAALTSNLLGRIVVEQVTEASAGSGLTSATNGTSISGNNINNTNSNISANAGTAAITNKNSDTGASSIGGSNFNRSRRSVTGSIHTFKVSVEDKFIPPNGFQQDFQPKQDSKVTRESTCVLPTVGSIVLARVIKLSLKQANVQIISVEHYTNPSSSNSSLPFQNNNTSNSKTSTGFTPLTENVSGASHHSAQNVPVSAESGLGAYGPVRGIVPFSQLTTAGGGLGGSSTSGGGSGNSALSSSLAGGSGGGSNGIAGLVNATDVGEGFGGIVRVQDVRMTERDKVKIAESFKPGDIIRASVVSIKY